MLKWAGEGFADLKMTSQSYDFSELDPTSDSDVW